MQLPPDIVARVSRRLVEHAGLELPAWVIDARTSVRIAALACDPEAYVELIGTPRGQRELQALVDAVRVGETSLFRHRQQIATLVDAVVPTLRGRAGRRNVQVWSAGCAAGQEPYTLAIVLSRALPGMQLSIVATDVSEAALDVGRANSYPRDALDDVPAEWQDAFVIDDARGVVRVKPEIAKLVRFERHNLVEPRRGATENGRFDVVWCRNVLIYFSADARRRALERLIASTALGGAIFVGHSESLRDVSELDAVRSGDAVYYVRRAVAARQAIEPRTPRPITARTPVAGMPIARLITPPVGVPVVRPAVTAAPAEPPTLVLRGRPDPGTLTTELAARFAEAQARVVVDLDGAELLDDSIGSVLRRATSAARAAGGALVLRATRTGTQRWLVRHGLVASTDEDGST